MRTRSLQKAHQKPFAITVTGRNWRPRAIRCGTMSQRWKGSTLVPSAFDVLQIRPKGPNLLTSPA